MMLVNNKYNYKINIDNDFVNVIVCENPIIYYDMIYDLFNTDNSRFILSHKDERLEIEKHCDIIINPLELNINNKKNIEKLYLQLIEKMNYNEFFIMKNQLYLNILSYINKISFECNYSLNYADNIEAKGLLKLLDICIEDKSLNFFEKINNYLKICNELQGRKIYIFINLKSFLSIDQLNNLYKNIIYNKYNVILFENVDRISLVDEKKIIIDKDGCIIG